MVLRVGRKLRQGFIIFTEAGPVRIEPYRIKNGYVYLSIEAPECIMVLREELLPLRDATLNCPESA